MIKICSVCHVGKDIASFGPNVRNKDRHQSFCRSCGAIQSKAWRDANPDRHKEHAAKAYAKWKKEHPGQSMPGVKMAVARYRKLHPEAVAASKKRYRERHPEAGRAYAQSLPRDKVNAQATAARLANPERYKSYAKAYADKYPERKKERARRWSQENPAKVARKASERRAATFRAIPPWLTAEDRTLIAEKFAEAKRLSLQTGVKHHVDHEIPLKGKAVSGLHVPWNLQVIPAAVNQRKWNKFDSDVAVTA